MINTLVLAVGSPLGQSIIKALKLSSLDMQIHAADIDEKAAGLHFPGVTPLILPLVREEAYLPALLAYIKQHNIKVIFPTIAAEHDFFARQQAVFQASGVQVVSCESQVFQICNDKYFSMRFLAEHGFSAPETVLCTERAAMEQFIAGRSFPMVLKPRSGASSTDVFIVKDAARVFALVGAFPAGYFVLQEFLSDPEDYTVGVFSARGQEFRQAFVIKRILKFGLSYSGDVIENRMIAEYCIGIAAALRATYSINVQLKLLDGRPCAYEINPRLSSTTGVRAHFGFNEPDMILRDMFGMMPLMPVPVMTHGSFSRYWEEFYKD